MSTLRDLHAPADYNRGSSPSVNEIIRAIYKNRKVFDSDGNEYDLHSSVDPFEGEFLHSLISSNPQFKKTLEVGLAFGLSALHICDAMQGRDGACHLILDPYQTQDWKGVGLANLQKAGFSCYEFREDRSEFVLPELARTEAGTFDLIFIDGWHSVDQAMVEMYYAQRLLKVGGYIVMDDAYLASVAKAITCVSKFPSMQLVYPAYRLRDQNVFDRFSLARIGASVVRRVFPPALAGYLLPRNVHDKVYIRLLYTTMVALKKVREDERPWDWCEPF